MTPKKLLYAAIGVLFLESLLTLVMPNMQVAAILLLASLLLFVTAAFRDRQYICWIPLAALIAEIQLFYLTASGALLIFYYVLLIVNLAFLFAARKKAPAPQLLLAALAGKVCLAGLQGINVYLSMTTGVPVFLGIAYTMLVITSAYAIAGMFRQIDRPDMSPKKFLVTTVLLLVPVCDLVLSFFLVYRERKSL